MSPTPARTESGQERRLSRVETAREWRGETGARALRQARRHCTSPWEGGYEWYGLLAEISFVWKMGEMIHSSPIGFSMARGRAAVESLDIPPLVLGISLIVGHRGYLVDANSTYPVASLATGTC